MRKLLLLLSCCFAAHAADQVIVQLVVTNGTENADTFTVNSDTRTWTNSVVSPASQVLTNDTIGGVTTNLWNHLTMTPFNGTTLKWVETNEFHIWGYPGQAMSASLNGDWGEISYSTNAYTESFTVVTPLSSRQESVRTNIATLLSIDLEDYSQHAIDQTSTVASELVGLTNQQTISGEKTFSGSTYFSDPQTTNLVNYGNAISSPGSVSYSEQFGTGATATNTDALAIGRLATAYGYGSTAIGNGAIADVNAYLGAAIGSGCEVTATNAVALGSGASASGRESLAIGRVASTGSYTNTVAIGYNVSASANNQFLIGRSDHDVVIPGTLDANVITNTTYHGTVGSLSGGVIASGSMTAMSSTNMTLQGTNVLNGIYRIPRTDYTSLANGDNSDIDFGTATYIKLDAGPSAAFTIAGITGGADGRLLILDNRLAYNLTIGHEDGAESTATNRIYCPTGTDMTSTTYCVVWLIYDLEDQRWHVLNFQD